MRSEETAGQSLGRTRDTAHKITPKSKQVGGGVSDDEEKKKKMKFAWK